MNHCIHWLGAGLSSAPGIRRLADQEGRMMLWNRTLARAEDVVRGLARPPEVRPLDLEALRRTLAPGDILVSMLPADMHLQVAQMALEQGAHFVSSSYISPDMQALDIAARSAGLSLVNEVGLDPGLDHLMAHCLVADFRASGIGENCRQLAFRSYCGGFPARANDFRYKFSWSPVGVLRALQSPARCIRGGKDVLIEKPWEAVSEYRALLPRGPETFEAYPNRDSLPFRPQYHFDPGWPVQEFVRGTLRLEGWSEAWSDIFRELDGLRGPDGETRLREMGEELWRRYPYGEDDPDRVVLCVELEARGDERTLWHRGYGIDARGNHRGSAMARLVSLTVSLAVDSIVADELPAGVSAGPVEPELVSDWLARLSRLGEEIFEVDYLDTSLTPVQRRTRERS